MASLSDHPAFDPIAQAWADRTAAARAAKAQGRRVAGYMGNTVPVELVSAAGFFPLILTGRPGEPTPLADRYMEDLFDPVVRSVFDDILAGRYDFLDMILLPRTSDSLQRMYYYLCELKRVGAFTLPEIKLVDLLHTPWFSSAEYNFARFGELREYLGAQAGIPVGDEALSAATGSWNERRRLLHDFAAARAAPASVRGSDAAKVLLASRLMDGAAFDAALGDLVGELAGAAPRIGARIVLAGSALDHVQMHELVETLGANVVGDHHGFGDHLVGPAVAHGGDPLRSLSDHYHRKLVSTRTYPIRPQGIVEFALERRADAVVFYFFAEEEALTWECPAQRRALEAAGVASLSLTLRPYAVDAAGLAEPLAAFLAPAGAEQGTVADA